MSQPIDDSPAFSGLSNGELQLRLEAEVELRKKLDSTTGALNNACKREEVLRSEVRRMRKALNAIAAWQMPQTSDGIRYEIAHGAHGARDFIKHVAHVALDPNIDCDCAFVRRHASPDPDDLIGKALAADDAP